MTHGKIRGSATRMEIVLFQSGTEPGLYAYTFDKTGATLSNKFAPWKQLRILTGPLIEPVKDQKELSVLILQTLRNDGFCYVCSRSTSDRLGLENLAATLEE